MFRPLIHLLMVCPVAFLSCGTVFGQDESPDVPVENLGEPFPAERELPTEAGPETPGVSVSPAEEGAAAAPSAGPGVFIREFRITGNTVVPDSRLREIAVAYEGRRIRDVELQELLSKLTRVYTQAGFATSRAVVPDQEIVDQTVAIHIIEGRLMEVRLTGEHSFNPEFLRRQISAGNTQGPLNVDKLNDRLEVLSQDRLFKGLHGRLIPGPRPDENVLEVEVQEGRRFSLESGIANDRSPAVGGIEAFVEGTARNLLGRGDSFSVAFGGSDGLSHLNADVDVPLNSSGTRLLFDYVKYDLEVVEEPLDALDIETRLQILEVGLEQELYRTSGRRVTVGASFARRRSESFLQGIPFSFNPGPVDGRADVSAARLLAHWLERAPRDVVSARVMLTQGVDALNSTIHDDGRPDSKYFTVLAQAQWLHRIGPRAGLIYARFNWQDASDALLPIEKFAIGGWYSVRGYRRTQFVRDNAWDGSIEYRLPVLLLPIPGLSRTAEDGRVYAAAFFDAGRAWNEDESGPKPDLIYGAGPGLRWEINRGVRAELYWGAFRHNIGPRRDDIQDDGIHFSVSVRPPF